MAIGSSSPVDKDIETPGWKEKAPNFLAVMFLLGATVGPAVDGIHGQVHLVPACPFLNDEVRHQIIFWKMKYTCSYTVASLMQTSIHRICIAFHCCLAASLTHTQHYFLGILFDFKQEMDYISSVMSLMFCAVDI